MKTVKLLCASCQKPFEKERREYNRQVSKGRDKFFCCLACSHDSKRKYSHCESTCGMCGSTYVNHESPKKKTKFCSRECSAKFSQSFVTEAGRERISEKVKKAWLEGKYESLSGKQKELLKECPECKIEFETRRNGQVFCSRECARASSRKSGSKSSYKHACQFKFNLGDFPNEFDFSLIQQHGWYKPANRGNNLGGVSRDHRISIDFGYKNNIDPKIISHPANCELLLQKDNFSKKEACSISLEQLKLEIDEWDKRYPNKNT